MFLIMVQNLEQMIELPNIKMNVINNHIHMKLFLKQKIAFLAQKLFLASMIQITFKK